MIEEILRDFLIDRDWVVDWLPDGDDRYRPYICIENLPEDHNLMLSYATTSREILHMWYTIKEGMWGRGSCYFIKGGYIEFYPSRYVKETWYKRRKENMQDWKYLLKKIDKKERDLIFKLKEDLKEFHRSNTVNFMLEKEC
jgi:hypothetical protein